MYDAISYKRFSSPKQARGDSERRQTDLARDYCERHQLRLIDTYLDAGLSGFTGEHLTDRGALRALLDAARAGKFKPGTHLIVESLDRLSRQEISSAVRLFLDILDTGLAIVTLVDGEQVFTKERVDNDIATIVIVIVFLSRANNEARIRRERALQAKLTARKKARAQKIPMSADCPRWLTLKGMGEQRHFVVDAARARVIEQIFSLCVSGLGERRIVSYLNERQVPTVSGYHRWRIGMVGSLLRNPAVIGRFHPSLSIVENGRRRRLPDAEGPIDGYFPSVISEALFEKAQLARKKRLAHYGNRTIPAHTNLVARLGRCAVCNDSLFLSQSTDGFSYLRCVNAHHWECSNRLGFPYRKLEAVLLAFDDLTELVRRLVCRASAGDTLAHPSKGRGQRCVNAEDREDRIKHTEHEGFIARFKAAKAIVESPHLQESLLGRRVLVTEIRRLFEGVVLHPNRVVTLHMKPDAHGDRIVFAIGYDGLRGIQVKTDIGTIGFIDRAALSGLVRPVQNGVSKIGADKQPWQPRDLGDLLKHTQIIHSTNGDWHAVAHDPTQLSDFVASAEQALLAEMP